MPMALSGPVRPPVAGGKAGRDEGLKQQAKN